MAAPRRSPRPWGQGEQRWLVVGGPAELRSARAVLTVLGTTRVLDVVVLGAEAPGWLDGLAEQTRAVGRRFGPLVRTGTGAGAVATALARRNPWLASALEHADRVVALTPVAAALLDEPVADLAALEATVCDPYWEDLRTRLDIALDKREGVPLPTRTIEVVARVLRDAGVPGHARHAGVVGRAVRLAFRLVRVDETEVSALLVGLARDLDAATGAPDPGVGPMLDLLDLAVALRRDEPVDGARVHAATRAGLAAADAAHDAGDPRAWLLGTSLALDVHFHRRLHVVAPRSPLVDDPAWWGEPVRDSRLVRCADSAPAEVARSAPGPLSVAYLPGTWPQHARPVLEVLEGSEHVGRLDVVTLGAAAASGLRPVPRVVGAVAGPERDLTETMNLDPDTRARVAAADVVVADWVDMGAVWASHAVRPGARLVLRAHSADALSAAAHLVDWGRVTDLVVVAEHVRDVLVGVLGERVAHVAVRVVPVLAPVVEVPDAPERDPHLVVLTGWSQEVKDPGFALDVLTLLRADDPRWRLRLVGPRVGEETLERAAGDGPWGRAFTARVADAEAQGWVEVTGQVDDVARHLVDAGHVLNTSLREGCPTAVIEGVWAGCLPVVRDWPLYAARGGAARALPRTPVEATVDGVAAALRRNAALLLDGDGEAERVAVRAAYDERFAPERVAAAWREVVTGVSAG